MVAALSVANTHITPAGGGNNMHVNRLKPNVNYSGHTAPPTSKVAFYIFIQQI